MIYDQDAEGYLRRRPIILNGPEHDLLAECNPAEVVGWHVAPDTLARLMAAVESSPWSLLGRRSVLDGLNRKLREVEA